MHCMHCSQEWIMENEEPGVCVSCANLGHAGIGFDCPLCFPKDSTERLELLLSSMGHGGESVSLEHADHAWTCTFVDSDGERVGSGSTPLEAVEQALNVR